MHQISKKGKASVGTVVSGVLCLVLTVLLIAINAESRHRGESDVEELIMTILPSLFAVCGLWSTFVGLRYGKTEIHLYDDHVEGVGLAKNATEHRFHFSRQTCNLQVSRSMIVVTNGPEQYKINLGAAEAQEVYHRFYGGQQPNGYPNNGYPNNYQNGYQNNYQNNNQNGYSGSNPNSAPNGAWSAAPQEESCFAFCTSCGQKVRVPRGRGHIRITCPHCRNCFDFDT